MTYTSLRSMSPEPIAMAAAPAAALFVPPAEGVGSLIEAMRNVASSGPDVLLVFALAVIVWWISHLLLRA